ncbi:MAG: metallophosphoesterase [Propionibacteriaceae bacterium]|nr:metallophosphoesterase [Propionibacteriaceae bacterium]
MGKTYFIADLHFGDSRIIGYENRPFQSAAHMDAELITRWNRTVGPDDRVFLLGDVAITSPEATAAATTQLAGYKILVLGNHDRHLPVAWWFTAGFQEVSAYPLVLDEFYLLSHEPLYVNATMPYANIFGHVHGSPLYVDASPQSFCVSAERIDYTPIEFTEIKRRIGAPLNPTGREA